MEPDRLKAEFGDQLTFYGGVDTQELLPRGDSEEIDREVRRLLDCMSSNGGYVFAAAHNLQGDVPPESIVAMFDSAKGISRTAQSKLIACLHQEIAPAHKQSTKIGGFFIRETKVVHDLFVGDCAACIACGFVVGRFKSRRY